MKCDSACMLWIMFGACLCQNIGLVFTGSWLFPWESKRDWYRFFVPSFVTTNYLQDHGYVVYQFYNEDFLRHFPHAYQSDNHGRRDWKRDSRARVIRSAVVPHFCNFRSRFNEFYDNLRIGPGDVVTVYFRSHGFFGGFYGPAGREIDYRSLVKKIFKANAKCFMFIADCCYSGSLLPIVERLAREMHKYAVVFTSTSGRTEAYSVSPITVPRHVRGGRFVDVPVLSHSYFYHRFLRILDRQGNTVNMVVTNVRRIPPFINMHYRSDPPMADIFDYRTNSPVISFTDFFPANPNLPRAPNYFNSVAIGSREFRRPESDPSILKSGLDGGVKSSDVSRGSEDGSDRVVKLTYGMFHQGFDRKRGSFDLAAKDDEVFGQFLHELAVKLNVKFDANFHVKDLDKYDLKAYGWVVRHLHEFILFRTPAFKANYELLLQFIPTRTSIRVLKQALSEVSDRLQLPKLTDESYEKLTEESFQALFKR